MDSNLHTHSGCLKGNIQGCFAHQDRQSSGNPKSAFQKSQFLQTLLQRLTFLTGYLLLKRSL